MNARYFGPACRVIERAAAASKPNTSVSGFFRFLAKVGDGLMKMQIVRLDFDGKA